jgi:two-component sensor histidine kinase
MAAPVAFILAPQGRDAAVAASILTGSATPRVCRSLSEVIEGLESAGCFLTTEEALLNENRTSLAGWLEQQPSWSDLPIIILTRRGEPIDPRLAFLDEVAVTLERPFQPSTLRKIVGSALKSRRRQFEVKAMIDEKVKIAERQRLLIRELHHRVKNTLANVQAMMRASARNQTDIETFTSDFAARLGSLAETHSLLTDDYWQTASLSRLLEKELEMYEVANERRVALSGPPVALNADVAVPLGMAVHELASNSSRHGALSVTHGRLDVTWSLVRDEEDEVLYFKWHEHDGPKVKPPTRKGFGSALLERVLAVQCGADIELNYDVDGFNCSIIVPLPQGRLVPAY